MTEKEGQIQWRIQGRGQRGLGPPYFWTKLMLEGPKKNFF